MKIIKRLNNEEKTEEIIEILKENLEKDYEKGQTKRDAHPKSLGLLKATFKVLPNIDERLKVGIFENERIYKVFIRTSSSSNKPKPDSKKDIRGFAIKLIDVDGKKVMEDEKYTQDFIFLSSKTMPLGTVDLFHQAIYYNLKLKNPVLYLGKMIVDGNLKKLQALNKDRQHQTSPLDIEYFSTTPYMYGNKIVKYKLVPTSKYKSVLPKKLTDTYLTDNMQNHLNNHIATFDFLVQIREGDMSIDDASVYWEGAPYKKVGELMIDKQYFRTEERNYLGEQLSFSPGHSLLYHKPIGGLNEARMKIYEEMSAFRHERNNKKLLEPTIQTYDELK